MVAFNWCHRYKLMKPFRGLLEAWARGDRTSAGSSKSEVPEALGVGGTGVDVVSVDCPAQAPTMTTDLIESIDLKTNAKGQGEMASKHEFLHR